MTDALPDPETLAVQALGSVDAVTTVVAGRISTRLSGVYPAIRVTLLGGSPRPAVNTGQPEFQIECFGDGTSPTAEMQAAGLANVVEAAIPDLLGVFPAGTVLGAYQIGFTLHSPTPDTNRERYIVQMGLVIQP